MRRRSGARGSVQVAGRSRAAFADRKGKRSRVAKPVTAAMLSSILPGTGEWYAGARRRAGLGWLVSFGLVGAVMIRLAGEPAVRLVVQPDAVVFLMAANGAMLLFRAGSAIDAYQVAVDALPARRAAQFRPAVTAVALVSLLGVTAAPHLVIAYYGLSALDFLTGVFVDEKADEVVAAAPPSAPASSTTSTTERAGSSSPAPIMGLPILELPEVSDPSIANPPKITPFTKRHDRITVLLIGGDAGPGRGGLRTDTMIVATMEPSTGKAALFSVPRNLGAVPLPRSFSKAFEGGVFDYRLNHIYGWAIDHPWYFPEAADPGAEALMQTIGGLLDLPIDYYALIDLGGFVDLIDALGGIDLYVPDPILDRTSPAHQDDPWTRIDLKVGYQHLSGAEALAYARSRSTSSDYSRMDRQRCLLGSLARQSDPIEIAMRIPSLVPVLDDVISTNIPLGHLPDLAETAAALNLADIISVRFIPPNYTSGYDNYGHPVPRVALIRDTVRRVLDGTFDQNGSFSPADLAAACG